MIKNIVVKSLTVFLLFSLASGAWALDADDQDSSDGGKPDSTSETEDATAGSGKTFEPPHDDLPRSTPGHADHQAGASKAGGQSLAATASDPTGILTMFQNFFYTTGGADDNNMVNTYLLQPVLPLSKSNLLRPALPVVNTSGKTGLGDLFLLDLQFIPVKSGTIGFGFAGSVPIGANEFSSNKWQLGPSGIYINKASKGMIWGALAYQQWSFAGKDSAQSVSLANLQPIFLKYEKWGYWGWTDQQIAFDWESNLTSVPLGLRFGNVTKIFGPRPVKIELGAFYTLNNKGRDNTISFKIQVSPIFAELLQH